MKKSHIIILFILCITISSMISVYASYLYNSSDVYYEDTNNIGADNVQTAIDKLYTSASDYSELSNKIEDLETLTGNTSLTTTAQDLSGAVNELNNKFTYTKLYTLNNVLTAKTYTSITTDNLYTYRIIILNIKTNSSGVQKACILFPFSSHNFDCQIVYKDSSGVNMVDAYGRIWAQDIGITGSLSGNYPYLVDIYGIK